MSRDSGSVDYRGLAQVTEQQYDRLNDIGQAVGHSDHTNLKPEAKRADIEALCGLALKAKDIFGIGPKTVCVYPARVTLCRELLGGSGIGVCAVVGFPSGSASTAAKVADTRRAVVDGASEIDMVLNIAQLRDGEDEEILKDIKAVVGEAAPRVQVKVIIECCYLNEDEKVRACKLVERAGAAFVKTSTGFGSPSNGVAVGATVEDVRLMRESVSEAVEVKAAGGMANVDDALAMMAAGATRLGASKVVADGVREALEILGLPADADLRQTAEGDY